MDVSSIGTAFFITTDTVLTAKHLLEDPDCQLFYKVWLFSPPSKIAWCPVVSIQRHPDLDLACATIVVPTACPTKPKPLTLSLRPLAVADPVLVYGYSHTEIPDQTTLSGPLSFNPRTHHGEIIHEPASDARKHLYHFDAETLGGTSGGPLFRASTMEVCGVISSGILGTRAASRRICGRSRGRGSSTRSRE